MSTKKDSYQEFLVGFITILGILILVFSIIWGKNLTSTAKYNSFLINFSSVNNLQVGDEVFIRGVKSGMVKKISLGEKAVLVEIDLLQDIKLYQDASARVLSKELMGGRIIKLDPGTKEAQILTSNQIRGLNSKGITEIIGEAGELTNDLRAVLKKSDSLLLKVNTILDSADLEKKLPELLSQGTDLIQKSEREIGKISRKLELSLNKINNLTDNGKLAIEAVKEDIHRVAALEADFKELALSLDSLAKKTSATVDLVNNPNGFIGQLLNNDDLYQEIRIMIQKADSLIKQVKKDGITTHISLF